MQQKPRTAFIVPYKFVPPVSGGQKAAYGFASFLGQKTPLTVITTQQNHPESFPFLLFNILSDSFLKYGSPRTAWVCFREFRKQGIKRCITHQPFIALVLLPVFWILGVRFEIFVQNIEYQRFRSIGKWWWPVVYVLEWLLFRMASRLLFISPDDEVTAQQVFKVPPTKCLVVHYGTEHDSCPGGEERSRQRVRARHDLDTEVFLIIFFGAYTYSPNLKAFELILNEISPLLVKQAGFNFRFLICGSGLPHKYIDNPILEDRHITYLGFVENIDEYIMAADVMLNPINTGGGVKTKAIDSIALGKTVVSSQSGARGIARKACGDKLIVVEDFDFQAFVDEIIRLRKTGMSKTPNAFYGFYHWAKTIEQV
jgi:hypothetical protein